MGRRLLAKLTLLAVTLLFSAAVLEVALRLIFARSLDFGMEMWKYAVQLKRSVPDPRLSFVHAPNAHVFAMGVDVRTNSQGLRDYEYPLRKAPGVYRIMILGDSTVLGWGSPLKETIAKVLEHELNRARMPGYDRVEVINVGIGNYNTVQEVAFYHTYGRAFQPDLVILQYFINDAEPVPRRETTFLIDRSYLVAFTASRWDGVLRLMRLRPDWKTYYASLYDDNRPGFQAAKAALRDLVATTRNDGVVLLVALLPELHQINGTYPFTQAHQKIKDVLAPEDVPVIELIEGLRNHGPEISLWVTPLDAHPSAKANHLIAAQMRDWILKNFSPPVSKNNGRPRSTHAP
jgi:lysophospholipase L1-like esterase